MTPTYHQHKLIFDAALDAVRTPPLDPDRGLRLMGLVADVLERLPGPVTDSDVEATIAAVMERLSIPPGARALDPKFRHDA
jgi:hypothetical protein